MKTTVLKMACIAAVLLAASCGNKQENEGYTRPKHEVEYIYIDFRDILHFDKDCPNIAVMEPFGTKPVQVYPIGMIDDVSWSRVCATCVEEEYLFDQNEDY